MGLEPPSVHPPADLASLCIAIAEHSPLPMAAVEGSALIVRYTNPAFCHLIGGDVGELVGKPLCELLPKKDECVTLAERVFRTGRPESHAEQNHPVLWSYSMWPLTANECRIGVMILVTETAQAHETAVSINEALVLSSIRQHELTEAAENLNIQLRAEISQREQAERALRESEERFRSLFASAPMAVFACDQHGVIQLYNAHAAEIWGREPVCGVERYCGSVRLWLPDGTLLPHFASPIAEVLRTGDPALNVEVSMERPDGSRVPVLENLAALKNGDGKITGAITSFMDLTERKKMEQRSLRSQRMESLGTLAGGIAHNLNNSFAPIMLSLDLLRNQLANPTCQELLDIIDSSARRGADMVRQVLSFARGVEGRRAKVDAPHLIRDVERLVRETFPRNIELRTFVPTDLRTVLGDATQIYQVLLNLCLNARDAMPNGGVLTVEAENREIHASDEGLAQNPQAQPGPYIMLEVKDDGDGMPNKIVESIFDPFFTTKDVGKGSGLGLSTALAIVKSHGGFLQVASELGKGTTFQVFIPAQIKHVSPPPPLSEPEMPRGAGELLLVVDDEDAVRTMMLRILEFFGYRVVLACNGAEAVAIYSQRGAEIAAVISDMSMPVMEGPEAIRILRGLNPKLPILGTTGFGSSAYIAKLEGLGVRHLLTKPYMASQLLKMVKEVLEGASLEPEPTAFQ